MASEAFMKALRPSAAKQDERERNRNRNRSSAVEPPREVWLCLCGNHITWLDQRSSKDACPNRARYTLFDLDKEFMWSSFQEYQAMKTLAPSPRTPAPKRKRRRAT